MKSITMNLVKFAVLLSLFTILFKFALREMLANEQFAPAWLVAALYGVIIFVIGWIFGKKEKESLPLYDVGFRFHLITFLVFNIITGVWHFLDFESQSRNVKPFYWMTLFWGIGLLLHFIIYLITRKNAIKGLNKSALFE